MKLLLTGQPRSGKTTLLNKLLAQVSDKVGFVSDEVLAHGQRVGFDVKDSFGNLAPLARINMPTPYPIGRYFVDLGSLEGFVGRLPDYEQSQLLYIDEIGQMQLYSSRFKELVDEYLNANNDFVGTITSVHTDDYTEEIKSRQDILICEVTPDNREELERGLIAFIRNRTMITALPETAQRMLLDMSRHYLAQNSYISFRKLFNNAVCYVAQKRVKHEGDGYLVEGNTNNHRVVIDNDGRMSCDCDLFNGRGKFRNQKGECSHIQAVKLSRTQS